MCIRDSREPCKAQSYSDEDEYLRCVHTKMVHKMNKAGKDKSKERPNQKYSGVSVRSASKYLNQSVSGDPKRFEG